MGMTWVAHEKSARSSVIHEYWQVKQRSFFNQGTCTSSMHLDPTAPETSAK